MNDEIAIEVENLKIRYRCLHSVSLKKRIFKWKRTKKEVFEAVRGISFQIKRGEIVGLIGKNGSGKSTTLRAIAGVFSADEGTIKLNSDSVALLSIGVGFQKKLTGRENIMLTGMLLGYPGDKIEERMDEIIEFSELGSFIDKPVKTYSSGMFSKLAFSITAILEPDIMLVDEVLAVGDAKFKKKSFAKMKKLIADDNRTVVIVSHNTETLRKLCDRIIWLHEGEIKMTGPVEEVLAAYDEFMS